MRNRNIGDEIKSEKSRFFADLRKVEIVRNGKRMRWDENKESFVEIKCQSGKKGI